MSNETHNITLTHPIFDIDFSLYYDWDEEMEVADITGIYALPSQVDLIDVIDDTVKEELEELIEEEHIS